MYFNYHAKAKKLISSGNLINYKIFKNWNGICPALVLFFNNHKPMPIRREKWNDYFKYINNYYLSLNINS